MSVKLYRYYVPNEEVFWQGWGCFVVSADGFVSCVTDYGNYGHWWPHDAKCDFRAMLANFDVNYIRRKMAPACEEFDLDATRDRFRDALLIKRRHLTISRDQAAVWWEELRCLGDEFDWVTWMRETDFPNAWDYDAVHSVPCNVQAFENRLLPRFLAEVRKDLAES